MSRATARRAFDALEGRLAPLAARHPGTALALAAALGRLRNRLSRRWPSPEQVGILFPQLGQRAAARVAWAIGGLEARNRLLADCIRRSGLDPVRPLVRAPLADLQTLRPPLILGTFHVGAVHALGLALERLPGPVLALRHGPLYSPRPPVEVLSTEGDDQRRAAAFQRALAHLGNGNGGGFVVLALDVVPGPGLEVSCLGRKLAMPRGPFAMARLAGVPIVPLVARWLPHQVGGASGVEVALGEALVPDIALDSAPGPAARETALAAAAARWLESYLLGAPGELSLGLLRALLSSSPSPAGMTGSPPPPGQDLSPALPNPGGS